MKNNKFKVFLIIFSFIIYPTLFNKVYAEECREGYGAFLVYDKTKTDRDAYIVDRNKPVKKKIVLAEDDFNNRAYSILVLNTFPVNTDPDFAGKDYNPKESDGANLKRALSRTRYGLIFLPRTLYELMYYYYAKSRKNNSGRFTIDTLDSYLDNKWKTYNSEQLDYARKEAIYSVISDKRLKQAYFHFNNWALKFLVENNYITMDQIGSGNTIYFDKEGLTIPLVKYFFTLCFENFTGKDYFFAQAVTRECSVAPNQFILHQAMRGGKDAVLSIIEKRGSKYTCTPFSQSYNSGLLPGIMEDQTAATGGLILLYDREAKKEKKPINGYMLVLNRSGLETKNGSHSFFHIPPIPVIAGMHAVGEFWHPRSKVMVPLVDGVCETNDPEVLGVKKNIGNSKGVPVKKLPWLQLNKGDEWPFTQLAAYAIAFEYIIKNYGINFQTAPAEQSAPSNQNSSSGSSSGNSGSASSRPADNPAANSGSAYTGGSTSSTETKPAAGTSSTTNNP